MPATIPSSGVRSPGSSAENIQNGSNDDPPPRRKKARVKKVTEPSPKVTYYDTPVKGKPESKPTKPIKKQEREGVSDEGIEEKPNKKLPTKPAKKPKDTDNSDEKEPAAKPAKSPKAEADGGEIKKAKPATDSDRNN